MKNTLSRYAAFFVIMLTAVAAWSQAPTSVHLPARLQQHWQLPTEGAARQTESQAKSGYNFFPVDFTGAPGTFAYDVAGSTIVGTFTDNLNNNNDTAFFLKGNVFQQFSLQTYGVAQFFGINTTGLMVGEIHDLSGNVHSLISFPNGTAAVIDPPGAAFSFAFGISTSGIVLGSYYDANNVAHGYTYATSSGQFTTVDFPGGIYTELDDMNASGEIVGSWEDSSRITHGFVLKSGTFTSFDAPSAYETYAEGINDKGQVAGFYVDSLGNTNGFVMTSGSFQIIEVPRAIATFLYRIKNNKQLVGGYLDASYEVHGFVTR
ncbi:MAG: hypothetical protein ACRD3Q_22015 [Terriglobales bacterium]